MLVSLFGAYNILINMCFLDKIGKPMKFIRQKLDVFAMSSRFEEGV